jgi:malto-oligosyltrehalose trehalohydrolase
MRSRFQFRKSWGAEPGDGGGVFRLWAPLQERVALRTRSAGDLPMGEAGDGWFQLETDAVSLGESYAFVLADGMAVNDPAARAQVANVDGPSRLIDPMAYEWRSGDWRGRPLHETVIYELHTGAFSPEGTFDGVRARFDHLAGIGVTAIELLPVAQFGGVRGWGYDGALFYAPHVAYGGPEALKGLIDETHQRGLMMFLDVVYNHFGPVGNFLQLYAPFFHPEDKTPWGAAIAYDRKPVRDFFIENALYWLEEYRFDGLRFDAIDQIARHDHSEPPFLEELAGTIRRRITDRHIHLMTEDDRNVVGLHGRDAEGRPILYSAEWNDDFHHAAHRIATAEAFGYYSDYGDRPVECLARALASGYIYQGEPSPYRDGELRGESSAHLPPAAFVNFIQNHDQIGNRAYSERLTDLAEPEIVEALLAILLLSPQIPLLFMGEEWGETRPFRFFTDFHGELATAVREGRRREFAKWPHFASDEHSALIADPNALETFEDSRLDWAKLDDARYRARLDFVRRLLELRRREIAPLIPRIGGNAGSFEMLGGKTFVVRWVLDDGGGLTLHANLEQAAVVFPYPGPSAQGGRGRIRPPADEKETEIVFAHGDVAREAFIQGRLPPLSVVVSRDDAAEFVPLPI